MPTEGMTAVPVTYQLWLVLLSIVMAIQGAYVGLSLAVQIGDAVGMRRRLLLAGAAFSLAVAIWTMHFRRDAGSPVAVPDRLSGVPDAAVVPGLRDRRRGGGLCHEFRPAHAGPLDPVLLPDGRRHLHDALHRHERAACERAHGPRVGLCRSEHGHCHCGLRTGALAGDRPRRTPAADPFGDRLRHRRFGNALYGDGRRDAFPARQCSVGGSAGAVDRPARDRCGDRRVLRFRHISFDPGAGSHAACRVGALRRYAKIRRLCRQQPMATVRPQAVPAGIEVRR